VINRWYGDHHELHVNESVSTTNRVPMTKTVSTRLLTTFHVTIKTGLRSTTMAMLTPSVYIFFVGQYGSSSVIHLNDLIDRHDPFQSLEIDEFHLTIPDTGMVDECQREIVAYVKTRSQIVLAEYSSSLEYGSSCKLDMRIYRCEICS
jgi:hypothetical protein